MGQRIPINIHSKSDCQLLIDRIVGTLNDHNAAMINQIQRYPRQFYKNDDHMFDRLARAILSNGSKYKDVSKHFNTIRDMLFGYNLNILTRASDSQFNSLCNQIIALSIPSRILIERKLDWIRSNASTFITIQQKFGSIWQYISSNIPSSSFDSNLNCYIQPNDSNLIKAFTKHPFKLNGVGLPICCEFFNTIGIDEFKPDTHTKRFINRLEITNSEVPSDIRYIGITISQTLGVSRKLVDSHIWIFCAYGQGQICADAPKCDKCQLYTKDPRICNGALPSPQVGIHLQS